MLRYESLLDAPEATLRDACRQLQLAWDPAMLDWPKQQEQIADINNGNRNFWITRGKSLAEAIAQYQSHRQARALPDADLSWLNGQYHAFNRENGYPEWEHPQSTAAGQCAESIPSFETSRRYLWETRHKPLRWLYSLLGVRNRNLIHGARRKSSGSGRSPSPPRPPGKPPDVHWLFRFHVRRCEKVSTGEIRDFLERGSKKGVFRSQTLFLIETGVSSRAPIEKITASERSEGSPLPARR